jgi:hypothetical protein
MTSGSNAVKGLRILCAVFGAGVLGACSATSPGASFDVRPVVSLGDQRYQGPASDPYARGKLHLLAGQFGLAVKAFRGALREDPTSVVALNALAATYDRMHRYDLAERYYLEALALAPESAQTLNNLGYSYLLQGRTVLALKYLERSRTWAEDQDNERVVANLALARGLLKAAEEPAEAVEPTPASAKPRPVRIERASSRVHLLSTRPLAEEASGLFDMLLVTASLSPGVASPGLARPPVEVVALPQPEAKTERDGATATPAQVQAADPDPGLETVAARWEPRATTGEEAGSPPTPARPLHQPTTDWSAGSPDPGLETVAARWERRATAEAAGSPPSTARPLHEPAKDRSAGSPDLSLAAGGETRPAPSDPGPAEAQARGDGLLPERTPAAPVVRRPESLFGLGLEAFRRLVQTVLAASEAAPPGAPQTAEMQTAGAAAAEGAKPAAGTAAPEPAAMEGPAPDLVIELSNGAGRRSMAERMRAFLNAKGLGVERLTNAESYTSRKSVIGYRDGLEEEAKLLAALLPIAVELRLVRDQRADLRLLLGGDLLAFDRTLIIIVQERAHKPAA